MPTAGYMSRNIVMRRHGECLAEIGYCFFNLGPVAVVNNNGEREFPEVVAALLHLLQALVEVIDKFSFGFVLQPVPAA